MAQGAEHGHRGRREARENIKDGPRCTARASRPWSEPIEPKAVTSRLPSIWRRRKLSHERTLSGEPTTIAHRKMQSSAVAHRSPVLIERVRRQRGGATRRAGGENSKQGTGKGKFDSGLFRAREHHGLALHTSAASTQR